MHVGTTIHDDDDDDDDHDVLVGPSSWILYMHPYGICKDHKSYMEPEPDKLEIHMVALF